MKAFVVCRNCGTAGQMRLSKKERPGQSKYRRPAATGVPCPSCKQHKLRRLREDHGLRD